MRASRVLPRLRRAALGLALLAVLTGVAEPPGKRANFELPPGRTDALLRWTAVTHGEGWFVLSRQVPDGLFPVVRVPARAGRQAYSWRDQWPGAALPRGYQLAYRGPDGREVVLIHALVTPGSLLPAASLPQSSGDGPPLLAEAPLAIPPARWRAMGDDDRPTACSMARRPPVPPPRCS
jgi:hypothetical protein